MAITQNTYTGNGSTVLYSFAFPYLDTADVKVSLNGTVTTAYTFANATTIQFNTAPANGAAIRIYRETNDASLQAVLSPGSSIRASDLNDNFDQLIYLGQEANTEADSATATANTALTNAATAISTANTASTNASAAVSTANTAAANASAAVSTANTASTNASNAVSTANTASTNASNAVTTANAATTTANNAVTTANNASATASTALTNANAAVSTANTASTNASTAVSTANTASSNASTAVTTANNALSTANTALSNSTTAISTANAASAAVAAAVIYQPVVDLAALALLTPNDGDFFELQDSTGADTDPSITGVTVGLIGAPGLTFRLRYDDPPGEYAFLGYFANDSETRYLKFSGGTLTGQLRGDDSASASTPGFAFDGDPNTGVGRPGADELALITGGTARLTIDPAGAVSIPGTLGVTGAVTGTSTVSGSALIPTGSSVPTNGVYLPSANNVAISTNGTGRLFVDASGRLLAGTSSSSSYARAVFQGNSFGAGQPCDVYLQRDTAGTGLSAGTRIANLIYADNAGNQFANIFVDTDASTSSGDYPGRIVFATTADGASSPTERLRITSDGKVGVGTSSVNALLEVNSTTAGNEVQRIEGSYSGTGSVTLTNWRRAGGAVAAAFKYNDGTSPLCMSLGTTTSHQFRIRTADTDAITIDTSQRVGIGVTSPSYALDVKQSSTGNSNTVAAKGGTNGGGYFWETNAGTTYGAIGYGDLISANSGSSNTAITSWGSQDLLLGTNRTERARIDTSGRLLVGTSTERASAYISTARLAALFERAGGYNGITIVGNENGSGGSYISLLKSRGTTTGSNTLVANGDNLGGISFEGTDGTAPCQAASILTYVDGTPGANDMPGRIVFSTTADGASSSTERMRITNSGYLKASNSGSYYAVTNPYHEFLGAGANDLVTHFENTTATGPYGIRIRFSGASPNNSTNYFLQCVDSSTTIRTEIRSNGGLANFQANNVNLSDRNAKKDISPAAGTWDCIKEWEIVNYRYKDQPDDTDLNLGVIAQQVAESCPEVITVFEQAKDDQPEKLGVKEQQMYWMAIKALQEAQVRIEALEAEVAALKAQ